MIWRLGVVGFPIEHSLSPELHEAGLAMAHLRGSSKRVALRDATPEDLRGLMGAEFDALSVTMPFKETAATICDSLEPVSQRLGVVNSLLARDGQVLGSCTDGLGFLDAVDAQFAVRPEGMAVVVFGAGGAARGIVDALVHAGVGSVVVHGRTGANVERLKAFSPNVFDHTHALDRTDLVVNTLPVHARSEVNEAVPGVSPSTLAIDITYEPRITAWRAHYEGLGCRTANGLGMLAYQAALQMQWWWDCPIDGARLLEAIQ